MARTAGGARNGTKQREQRDHRLNKDELFQRLAQREEDYQLPAEGGGGTIRIRGLNVQEGAPFVAMLSAEGDPGDRLKRLCLLGVIAPPLTLEDLERLNDGALDIVSGIASAIMRLSGLTVGAAEDFSESTKEPKLSTSTVRKPSTGSPQR